MDKLPPGADLNLIPIAPPPYPGYIPKLHEKAELADITVATCTVVIALQVIFLGIRFFTKFKAKNSIAYDDWCALVTAILSFAMSGCLIYGKDHGRRAQDISIASALDPTKAKVLYANLILLGPAVYMGKITLLVLYLRLFANINKVRWSIYVAAFFGLTILAMLPLDAAKCGPIPGKPWGMVNPKCNVTFLYGVIQGVASLAIDLFILILPIPIIMGLHLTRRKRLGVLVIFLTGIVAIIADIIVMKYRVDLFHADDPSWAGYIIILCSIVETGISVVCSSMPTLAKFGRQHLSQWSHYRSLRDYFTGGRSSAPSGGLGSIPNSKPKKRFDPYSINMPTDNSVTQLTSNTYVELKDHGNLAPAQSRDITRTVSVEQSSITYSQGHGRDMV